MQISVETNFFLLLVNYVTVHNMSVSMCEYFNVMTLLMKDHLNSKNAAFIVNSKNDRIQLPASHLNTARESKPRSPPRL